MYKQNDECNTTKKLLPAHMFNNKEQKVQIPVISGHIF